MLQLESFRAAVCPAGVMVRESPSKASLGSTTVRAMPGGYAIGSFFDIFTEVSLDGGATWSPIRQRARQRWGSTRAGLAAAVADRAHLFVEHHRHRVESRAAQWYLHNSASGGCPPVSVNCNPPSGSTFPIGTTMVTCFASDRAAAAPTARFTVTVTPQSASVPEYFTPFYLLPPPNTVYISPALWHVLYNNGIIIRDIRHKFFTQQLPPPPLGASQIHTFGSELDFEVSFDNGNDLPARQRHRQCHRPGHTQFG